MNYRELTATIRRLIESASEARRREFALDTITRLHEWANHASESEHNEEERRLFSRLSSSCLEGSVDDVAADLQQLSDEMARDPVRAIEFDGDIVEYLCALEHWLTYRRTNDLSAVLEIEVNMINRIDHRVVGTPGYAIDMLVSTEMSSEYLRVEHFLAR